MLCQRVSRLYALEGLKSVFIKCNRYALISKINGLRYSSLEANKSETPQITKQPEKKVSKAMKAYLERAREHDEFMKKEREQFQIGKRHLANMMGEDPETFTQEDINNAIEYLFPSGLYDKKARPLMKPPEEIFPERKAAEFDETGRPHHFLFYTSRPNFYQYLHEAVQHMEDLNKFEDSMIRKGLQPDPNLTLELSGYKWMEKELVENKLVEKVNDKDYDMLVTTLERLSKLPYSYKVKDFIVQFMSPLISQNKTTEVTKLQYDSEGRAFVTTYECLRKTARGHVTIRSPGTGKIVINEEDVTYFKGTACREQLMFPLIFTNMLNKVDVECHIEGGGPSGQSGALRWGIAWSLRSFVDGDMLEKLRLAGLLTRDIRRRERKKPGQPGARKKYTWKKR